MRWNCPHCGISLAVSDEKLDTSWSFSRCYKCAGFALVRRADSNLIKVDRAPAGEQVLLPEAHEEPTGNLSRIAANHLAHYTGDKPVIRPAQRRSISAGVPDPTLGKVPKPPIFPRANPIAALKKEFKAGLPEPLPEEPIRSRQKTLNAAIGLAGILAIASGIYLYVQGQALWESARESQTAESTVKGNPTAHANSNFGNASESAEVIQAPPLTGTNTAAIAPTSAGSANAASIAAVAVAAVPIATPPQRLAEVADHIHASSMAPVRDVAHKMTIEVLTNNAHIHSGPGMNYPIVGTASNQAKYTVEDRRDRWFKIILENHAATSHGASLSAKKTAWIRNDLVRAIH
jgi:hypothetical protein